MRGLQNAVGALCDERGWIYGCPIPSMGAQHLRQLTIAKGVPGREHFLKMQREMSKDDPTRVHACSVSDVDEETWFRLWERSGERILIGRDSQGHFTVRESHAKRRLKFLLDSITTRIGAVTSDSEWTAMEKLMKNLNDTQWESYVLNGAFCETSPRSQVRYLLRKGLPTIAFGTRDKEDLRFLAALCLHPLAYYTDTWCGSMTPSDEVLAHLLMIRADEYRFWKKAFQHSLDDPASGI